MKGDTSNPYLAPPMVSDDRMLLAFDGVIGENDYAQLLPNRDLESLLYKLLLAILALITLLLFSATMVAVLLKGWNIVLRPVVLIGTITAVGTIFIIYIRRPIRRSRRNLKKRPDLLGVARGQLTESGLEYYDGMHHHWFGPHHLLTSKVTSAGIRVRVSRDPRSYLALTARMFDHYSEEVATRLQQCWHKTVANQPSAEIPPGWEQWSELNPIPDGAVAFCGTITSQLPLRTPQVLGTALIELVSAIACLTMGLLELRIFEMQAQYVLLVLGMCGLINNILTWRRYFRGMSEELWIQRGWISTQELAILRQSWGVRLKLNEIREITDYGTVIALTDDAGASFYFARDHVESDADWESIRLRCPPNSVEKNGKNTLLLSKNSAEPNST